MKYIEVVRCTCGSSTVIPLGDNRYRCLNCGTIFERKNKKRSMKDEINGKI